MWNRGWWCGAALCAAASAAHAQNITVQQPSFHSIGVDTTVIVPDAGRSAFGARHAASASGNVISSFPPRRAMSVNRQGGGQQVLAHIHDAREADEALLSKAKGANKSQPGGAAKAARSRPRDSAVESVEALTARRALEQSAAQGEAYAVFERGRAAQAAGKNAAAMIYYRAAAKHANARLRGIIDVQLRSLAAATSDGATSRRAASTR